MTLEALGRRAVACKHFRWMPGMYIKSLSHRVDWPHGDPIGSAPHIFPDFSDPATLGCLLALVREAWTCRPGVNEWMREISTFYDGAAWRVGVVLIGMDTHQALLPVDRDCKPLRPASTEAEAILAALEAAP